MGYIKRNENPSGNNTGDCAVRALSTLLFECWETIFIHLCSIGYYMAEAIIEDVMQEIIVTMIT